MDVRQYLNSTFKSLGYIKTDKYEVGVILFTANPFYRTNATIISEIIPNTIYTVLTDIGNILDLSVDELKQFYLSPVCKRTSEELTIDNCFRISDQIENFKYDFI